MTTPKRRLTITVDAELVDFGHRAVTNGEADSLSSWVSTALADRVRRDQPLGHLCAGIADYEAEFGDITAAEIDRRRSADREDAVVVRGHRHRATVEGAS